jgi:hypothetical protein
MNLAIAVICTGLAASLMGYSLADALGSQVVILAVYAAGCRIIDWYTLDRGPTDRNKPY